MGEFGGCGTGASSRYKKHDPSRLYITNFLAGASPLVICTRIIFFLAGASSKPLIVVTPPCQELCPQCSQTPRAIISKKIDLND